MENYYFENLQINHKYYDNIELILSAIHSKDLSINFKRELDKKGYYFLYDILREPLTLILGMESYKPTDIHLLLFIAAELEMEFGILPKWSLPFIKDRNKDEVERFLHCKLRHLSYVQQPSLGGKEIRMLRDDFNVERVYQFLRIDRAELAKVKYTGKKILESLDYFIDSNDVPDLKIS